MNTYICFICAVISMIVFALAGLDVIGTIILGIIIFIICYLTNLVWDWITKHLFK